MRIMNLAIQKRSLLALLAALAMAVLSGITHAQVISWNLDNNGTVGGAGAGDRSGVGEEAGVVLAGNWTNSFPSNITQDLQDSTGASTLLDIAPMAPFTFSLQGTHPGQDADGSWNKEMLNGYLNAGSSSTPAQSSIALSQIPYSSYDIYVYFGADDATRAGTVSLGGTTYDFNVLDNMIGGADAAFAQTTSTGGAQPEANYAVFSGLSGASQTISVNIPDFGGISGFQVVNNGAVASAFTWKNDASGVFGVGANWVGDTAPGAGANVRFGNVITEDRTVTFNSNASLNSITFDNVIGDGDYFLVPQAAQTVTLTGDARITTFGRHWVRTGLAGAAVNTLGNGELILDAVNTFGALNINETSATVTKAGAIPAGAPITIQNNGALRFFGADNGFFASNGTGINTGVPLAFSSAVSLVDGASFIDFNDGVTANVSGVISGQGALGVQGATVTVLGANTYNGPTNVVGDGLLTVTGAGTLGGTAGGTSIFGEGSVVLNGVTVGNENFAVFAESQLRLTGATVGAAASAALVSLDENNDGETPKIVSTGASTLRQNINGGAGDEGGVYEIRAESGTLNLLGVLSAADDAEQRTYVFSGAGSTTVNKIIDAAVDASGNFAGSNANDNVNVVKRGSGTLTINTRTNLNDDYWYGQTTIEGGTLEVISDGSNNGELRSTVNVNSGATFDVDHFATYNVIPIAPYENGLGGAGTVVAQTLGVFESATISPGDSVGTLKVQGNMTLSYFDSNEATVPNSGSLNFELGNDATIATVNNTENDLISVSGTLTVNRSAVSDQFIVNVSPVDGLLDTVNNYTLMRGASRVGTATAANFAVNFVDSTGTPVSSRYTAAMALNANSVQLNVNGGALNLAWSGLSGGAWDVNSTANWNGGAQVFRHLDVVNFSGGGSTVNVAEPVSPSAVNVTNTAYAFEGDDINAFSVNVGSNGTATFSNSVGGNIAVANTGTVAGAGTFKDNVTVQNGGTLQVGGANLSGTVGTVSWNVDVNGTIGGDGAVDSSGQSGPSAMAGVELVGNWTGSWNGAFQNFEPVNLIDHNGDSTPIDLVALGFNNFSVQGTHPGQDGDGSWNKELINGYSNAGASVSPAVSTITVSQIPYGQYDIIAYFSSDSDSREGSVSDGTTTYYFNTIGGPSVSGANAVLTEAVDTVDDATDPDANYAIFSNLSGANKTITVNIPDFGGLAGIQIVGDPNSIALAGETMSVLGDVSLQAGSTASFNIAGDGLSDLLDIGGNLGVADGFVLEVLLDASVPAASLEAGDSWDLFDFATSSGAFDEADFLLPSGLGANLAWDTSTLLVDGVLSIVSTANALGDFNGDGLVDAIDYAVWRENLGQDASAIMNNGSGAGTVVPADFDVWLANFGANYNNPAPLGQSPEPQTLGLLSLVLAHCFGDRRWSRRGSA